MNSDEYSLRDTFPLRHIILYKWYFGEAKSLEEVSRRLNKSFFYAVKLRDDMLIITSLSKPGAVVLTLIRNEDSGGDLILVQTPLGHYNYDKIAVGIQVFAKIAGIKVKEVKIIPEQKLD